jgi:hypothetical protein
MGIIEAVRGFQMRNDSKTVREPGKASRERFEPNPRGKLIRE